MKRLTPEVVREIGDATGMKLVGGQYCNPTFKQGCAVAFAVMDSVKDIYETDRIIEDAKTINGVLGMWKPIAKKIDSDPHYLEGLEDGFEDFDELQPDHQTEPYKQGLEDGRSIRHLRHIDI